MNAARPELAELFPPADYRFRLTLRRGDPADFFRPAAADAVRLAERARWVVEDPERYVALTAPGEPLLAEFAGMAAAWGIRPIATASDLARTIACDVLLLSPDESGQLRLRGGALCFPTGWALREKLGRTLAEIHGIVPGLNPALALPIDQFLKRMKPGLAFLRDNWGIAATNELNLHPARDFPRPELPVKMDRLWLRVEHQALLALPQNEGIAFGIDIALHRLDTLPGTAAAPGLRRALETMPPELAEYKGIERVRREVAARL